MPHLVVSNIKHWDDFSEFEEFGVLLWFKDQEPDNKKVYRVKYEAITSADLQKPSHSTANVICLTGIKKSFLNVDPIRNAI